MNLAAFSAISNGKYNLGTIRLQGEGEQATLTKINNHRWFSNNDGDNAVENSRVRDAFCAAIRNEVGIPQELVEKLAGDLTSVENRFKPLERRTVRNILQQIGENRLKEYGICAKFPGDQKLSAAVAFTALACLPGSDKARNADPMTKRLIVSAAIKAVGKGKLAVNKNFSTEVRVQVFHSMFKNLPLQDIPTDAELRAMTPVEFFDKCAAVNERFTMLLSRHEAGDYLPDDSLFSKYHENRDWNSVDMQKVQMQDLDGNIGGGVFSPGDLRNLKDNVKEFNLKNLPSVKVAMESRVGLAIEYASGMTEEEANQMGASKFDKDVVAGRLKGELRFSVDNDSEFVTIDTNHADDKVIASHRSWIKGKIDEYATTRRQAASVKLMLSQEPLQPFRELAHMLGLEQYNEHTGFNYYLNENEDGSLKFEIKKDFTEFGARNISAAFNWRIETDGTAVMEDFKIKLP